MLLCWQNAMYVLFVVKYYFVFEESGQPQEPLDHQFLAKELNIIEDHTSPPV